MALKETLMNKFYEDKFVFMVREKSCLSRCLVKNDGTRIGSVNCRECENLIKIDVSPKAYDYIICSKIDEALGEFSQAVVERNKKNNKDDKINTK